MTEKSRPRVFIEEDGPRDGLQNEPETLSVQERVDLINMLSLCGFQRVQVGSFVHPGLVPQMAGTEEVLSRIHRAPHTVYSVLVLNEKGLDRALSCGVEHVSIFVSASETHSVRNTNCSVREGTLRAGRLVRRAKEHGVSVQAGVMNAFGCRFEGGISPEVVMRIVSSCLESGADEINLADSAGVANPHQIEAMVPRVWEVTNLPLSLHLHDTYGFGLANVYAAWNLGVTRFDACCGGLGGCPFIPGAAGNVATEDMAHLFQSLGVETGILPESLNRVVLFLEQRLGRRLPGRYAHGVHDGGPGCT